MKKWIVLLSFSITVFLLISFTGTNESKNLRRIYSRPSNEWPKPFIDSGIIWSELSALPESPLEKYKDSLKHIIELGKILFFDPRLSGSGKISCATCHQPELNWTDGKEKSVGHEGAINKRNSPTIQNTWFYHRLFWDGRAKDLQDQAFAPIVSESEMGSDMPQVMMKLRRINGYKDLFKKAYGDEGIDPERLTGAIATFEKTITSRKSRFDEFLEGNSRALTNSELRGLHLFRTKAGCMSCHYGPLFTDNKFQRHPYSTVDEGYYKVTHNEEDKGYFKTPSLRDVVRTGPWMHNGGITNLHQLIEKYTNTDIPDVVAPIVKNRNLSFRHINDLVAFLKAISAEPAEFQKPVLPE